jgi:hypothetical protein
MPCSEGRRWRLPVGSDRRTRRVVRYSATEQPPAQLGDLRRLSSDRRVEETIRSLECCDLLLLRRTEC